MYNTDRYEDPMSLVHIAKDIVCAEVRKNYGTIDFIAVEGALVTADTLVYAHDVHADRRAELATARDRLRAAETLEIDQSPYLDAYDIAEAEYEDSLNYIKNLISQYEYHGHPNNKWVRRVDTPVSA